MLVALLYFAVGRLLRLLTLGGDRDGADRDIAILVLRHQLQVLSRGRRLQLLRRDRVLLAAASRLLPRERSECTPQGCCTSTGLRRSFGTRHHTT